MTVRFDEHRDLEQRLVDELEAIALRCPDAGADLAKHQFLRVRDHDVGEVARCQAKVAGTPKPFEADPFTTHKAIALAAIPRLKTTSVHEAVSKSMRAARDGDSWYADYLQRAPRDVRSQTAVRSITWLSRTLAVLDEGTLDRWQFDRTCRWQYPGRGLLLTAKIDLVRPGPIPTPIAVVGTLNESTMDRIAFRLLLWTLANRSAPSEGDIVVHATAKRLSIDPRQLLARGINAARIASDAVTQRGRGPEGLTRRASPFTCQRCDWFVDCPTRTADGEAIQIRGGIRLADRRIGEVRAL